MTYAQQNINGCIYYLIPKEDLEKLQALAEDAQDLIDFNQAKQEAKEFFPQDILDKLCNNHNPVQVFRKYRTMTQEELALACHISRAFLAQIETGKNTGICLSEQVRTSINNKKYPVFITEGTLEHKKQRINTNAYLGRSFSSLKNIGGNLFIFGHSLRDEDNHVFDVINKNDKLKNIFISIYGDIGSEENKKITEKVERWKTLYNNKKYYFYDATSANVWTNTIDQPN